MLEGKAAVVTGGGRGIGRATALQLARLGAAVLVNDLGVTMLGTDPDPRPAAEVVAEIRAQGGRAGANTESVTTEEGARRIIADCLTTFGRIDILVNNAGIHKRGLFTDLITEDFDRMIAVHLKGAWGCTQAAVPHLTRQGSGRIINMTSRGGLAGPPGYANYGMAKAGIMGFTFVLARELRQHGITVNAVAPVAETRMSLDPWPESLAPLRREWGFVRSGRAAPADDVAALIAYLASDAAAGITGQIVSMEGRALGIWSPPSIDHTVVLPGGWQPEQVAEHLPALIRRAGEFG
jgi:NAD(P)-dependent dehydrogenase (short-subunit alcohol dehydrogenase family)